MARASSLFADDAEGVSLIEVVVVVVVGGGVIALDDDDDDDDDDGFASCGGLDEDGFGEETDAIKSSGNAGAANGSDADADDDDGFEDTKRTVAAASC